jgi:leader peptidase (prepilin peptidase) / N-methyltransferase
LNVVIYRLEKGEDFVKGRSYCPHCKHSLAWYDLVPVFSFLLLLGKCRYCRAKISVQYPIVELCTGFIFILIFWSLGFNWELGFGNWDFIKLCFMLYIASSLIVIFVYDLSPI